MQQNEHPHTQLPSLNPFTWMAYSANGWHGPERISFFRTHRGGAIHFAVGGRAKEPNQSGTKQLSGRAQLGVPSTSTSTKRTTMPIPHLPSTPGRCMAQLASSPASPVTAPAGSHPGPHSTAARSRSPGAFLTPPVGSETARDLTETAGRKLG